MDGQDNQEQSQAGFVVNPSGWSPILEDVAKAVAALNVDISTRGGRDENEEVYKKFREVYKKANGHYSTVYLPLSHDRIDSTKEYADTVLYLGDDRDYRDLIMLKSARSLIAVAVPGKVPGLQVKDVISAIGDRKIHVIIFIAEANSTFIKKLEELSPDAANSPLLHKVYDIENFKMVLQAIESGEI